MKTRAFVPLLAPLLFVLAAPMIGCDDDEPLPPNTARAGDGAADGAIDGAVDGAVADAVSADGAVATDGADASASDATVVVADAAASDGAASDTSASDAPVAACGVGTPAATPAPVGIAIVNSDRMSTSVSLLALGGTAIAHDNCLTSGSVSPQLSAALSGDVVLPSTPQPHNDLALIDRKNATVTWVDPATCTVKHQLNVGTGFAANPYDLVGGLGNNKGYVPRYNANPANAAEGSDILIIDTECGTVKGHIDLRAAAAPGPAGTTILPFPSRALAVGGKVYVVLNDLSADYSASSAGRLAVIDSATDTVSGTIDLPGLQNCGALDHVKTATGDALVVGCNGPFSAGAMQIDSAGVAWVDLSTTPAKVTVVASKPFGAPVSGFDVAATPDVGFTVIAGDFTGPRTDALWSFDWKGTAPTKRKDADSSFSLALAIDHAHQTLYLLDAAKAAPMVHIFAISGAVPTETGTFVSNPATGLPPRQLALY